MSSFVQHEPCPKCKSRDNLGRYADGSAWCFGCGHYEPAKRTLANAKIPQKQQGEKPGAAWSYGTHCTSDIPNKPLRWLRSYGITDEEIERYGILWDSSKGALLLGSQLRFGTFEPGSPKHIVTIRREGVPDYLGGGPIGIFVEDFISAIKVGRSWAAIPVYGSNIDAEALDRAASEFLRVGIWLDSNMTARAFRTVSRARVVYGEDKFFRIYSKLDPKYYNTQEIDQLVSTHLRSTDESVHC